MNNSLRDTSLRKLIWLCAIGLVLVLCFSGVVFYVLSFKVKRTVAEGESLRFKRFVSYVVEEAELYSEGLLNSFAMWEDFANAVKRRDVAWLEKLLFDDAQVAQCDAVGVLLSNGDVLISRGLNLPKNVALILLKEIRKRYPLGTKAEHFFHTLLRINGKVWLLSIAPMGNDNSKVISYDALYFAFSQESLIKRINKLFVGVHLCNKPKELQDTVEAFPLRDFRGQLIAWVTAPIAKYIHESFDDLLLAEGFVVALVVAYVIFVVFLLRVHYNALLSCLNGVAGTFAELHEKNDLDLADIEELSLRDDEVGRIAKRLVPLIKNISFSVLMDSLTGAYNRRVFFKRLDEELERFKRYKRPFCLVLVDIDDFKRINDCYGHPFGDFVLSNFSRLIRERIRGSDVFGRIGGEEFGIILVETNIDDAFKVCEKLRTAVEEAIFEDGVNRVRITASFGVTQVKGADTVGSLYERADRALYMAKEAGKNRVVYLP